LQPTNRLLKNFSHNQDLTGEINWKRTDFSEERLGQTRNYPLVLC